MKQNYTKLMALVAMFLLVGVNASAGDGWNAYNEGYDNNITVTTSYTNVFSANALAKVDQQVSYSRPNLSETIKAGLLISATNKLYLKPTTGGFFYLRIACEGTEDHDATPLTADPLTVTIHDNTANRDVASIYVETPVSKYTAHGETKVVEIEANHEYVFNASNGKVYYLTNVSKLELSEYLELNEEQTAAQVQAAIAGNTTSYIVKLHRALTAGIWNTFSSPKNLGKNAIKLELKSDAVYEMQSYSATDHTITFKKSTYVYANRPYLVKPTEDVSEILIFSTTAAEYNPKTVKSGNLSFKAALGATNIYTTGDANSTKFFLNKSNKLVYPTSNEGNRGMIKGFRAYFESTGPISNLVKEEGMTFIFDDEDDPTGIIRVEQDIFNENGRIYSVDGRYVGDSRENLSRGIYIQNGRKFIVK